MFSFGIEYERAFSTAFASARFAAGSGPPSRAATMIARASLEKSLPRLASAAPFLCLIDDHLLCPDIRHPDQLQEELVHASVVGQLRVERRDEDASVPQQHRLAVELGQHLDTGAALLDAGGADEHAPKRRDLAVELEVRLEARDLAAVGVAVDEDVREPEVRPVEDDHPCARAEDRPAEALERLVQPVEPDQTHDRSRPA